MSVIRSAQHRMAPPLSSAPCCGACAGSSFADWVFVCGMGLPRRARRFAARARVPACADAPCRDARAAVLTGGPRCCWSSPRRRRSHHAVADAHELHVHELWRDGERRALSRRLHGGVRRQRPVTADVHRNRLFRSCLWLAAFSSSPWRRPATTLSHWRAQAEEFLKATCMAPWYRVSTFFKQARCSPL